MFWEKNKDLIILAFIWILASIVVLFILDLKTNERVEAWAIATLVIVTIFYAGQTQKLVEQEKISLKDQKKKRHAEFGKERLEDFYYPVRYYLTAMGIELKKQNINFITFEKFREKIRDIHTNKVYMATDESDNKLYKLLLRLLDIRNRIQINALEIEVKKEVLDELEETKGLIYKEIFKIEKNIKSVFLYFVESKPKSKTTNKKKQKGGNKEMNKPQKIVIGIVLISMGVVTFILAILIGSYLFSLPPFPPGYVLIAPAIRKYMFELYPVILLGIAFTGGGIFLLVSKKRKGE